eukprot:scaffold12388_cov122-Isochrysis_galbana.AAC.2
MEQKDFDGCIATCKKGIEKGREAKVDYKIIAKSFLRIGNAYKKLGKLDDAIRAYEDSLMEDRSEEAEKLLKQTRALKKKVALCVQLSPARIRAHSHVPTDEEAYCSPEKAEEARQKGNELFKAGSYAAAVEMYTEAMKRNPKDHVPYSNRAACYQKLMEWQLAIKDADRCVEMDPMFVKGWSRKAGIHFFLKEYHKALDAYDHILKLDPNNEEAKSMTEQVLAAVNSANHSGEIDHERQARAMQDPEILAILGDPQMRSILGEMQSDPKKAKAVMNDPSISAKLQKLIAAGVLQVRANGRNEMRASRSEDAASRRMGWWRSVRAFLSRHAHCNASTCLRGCTLQCFDSIPRTDEISGSGRSTKASNDARSLVLFPLGCGAPRLRFSPATWRHIVCVTRGVALALAASCSLAAFGSLVRSLLSCLVRVLLARW